MTSLFLLQEVKRSKERSKKLVDNLKKRANRIPDKYDPDKIRSINKGNTKVRDQIDDDMYSGYYSKSSGKKKIAITDIHSSQGTVFSQGVKNKLDGEKSTPAVNYHKESGKYYMRDGHHQLMRRKLLGMKYITADVYHRGKF